MLIQPFGFYVLRRHLVPVDGLFVLNETCDSLFKAEEFLRSLFSSAQMQESLYNASPDFYARFRCWLSGEEIAEKNRLVQTLFKYYLRMCSRCTPYGMFAGCTTGEFDDETHIIFDETNPYQKFSRLDSNYIFEIVNFLLAKNEIRSQLKYYSNNTIYQIADKYHYLYYVIKEGKRAYSICSVDFTEYINQILEKAKMGCFIKDLINVLVSEDISEEQAHDFVEQLIDEQLLISEIEPTITGEDFFSILLQKLSSINIPPEIFCSLQKIKELLQNPNLQIAEYDQINILLKNLVSNSHQDIIQTDLFFNTSTNTIEKKIAEDLSRKVEKLLALNSGNYSMPLEQFKKQFYERYEETEMPLALVLDNEAGIGYADFAANRAGVSPLIEDISLITLSVQEVLWVYWKKFTLKKYTEALQNQDFEIILTDTDLALLEKNHTEFSAPLNSTFYVFGSLLADQNFQHNYSFHLKNISGASATTILGRFCNGDENLHRKLRECIEHEENQNKNVIYAEIVHSSEARIGNITTRPKLRNFEIPYQTPSSVSAENQILIEDLMVSVRDGKQIVLRSKKHNKRIIPRLSSAHNYQNGLSIYQFLCDLQSADECTNVYWHWHLLGQQPFLPRVSYQNIILSPAIWNLNSDEEKCFLKKEVNITNLKELQKKYKIPRYVTISEADNELWIDFENEICLMLLKDFYLKNTLVRLKEVLFTPQNCFLKNKQGSFINEVVIPFRVSDYKAQEVVLKNSRKTTQANFSVGSEWLYFKLYCGEKTGDEILKTTINNFVNELLDDNIIDSFFFIRYQDPKPHLRLRFKGNPQSFFYATIINRLNEILAPYQENGLIYETTINTYKREIERYGENTMALSEELFFVDSIAVMDFISTNPDDSERFLFAIRRINSYLAAFQLDLKDKKIFAEMLQQKFLEEFGDVANLRKKLNNKYRVVSNELIDSLTEMDVFNINNLAENIIEFSTDKNQLMSLLSSYIHMFVNRLFISNNRTYELTLYHFLTKIYITLNNFQKVIPENHELI